MGLSHSPWLLYVATQPLQRDLREIDEVSACFIYADDILLNFRNCPTRATVDLIVCTIEEWGFTINRQKSSLKPSQKAEWLGLRWQSSPPLYSFTAPKLARLAQIATSPKHLDRKVFERRLGFLAYVAGMVPFGQAFLYDWKRMLAQWRRPHARQKPPILTDFYSYVLEHFFVKPLNTSNTEVFADATPTVIAYSSNKKNPCLFVTEALERPIFNNELLLNLCAHLQSPSATLRGDNQAALHCFNSSRSHVRSANEWIRQTAWYRLRVLELCEFPAVARYVRSELNPAD
jgi:hypothetical protein